MEPIVHQGLSYYGAEDILNYYPQLYSGILNPTPEKIITKFSINDTYLRYVTRNDFTLFDHETNELHTEYHDNKWIDCEIDDPDAIIFIDKECIDHIIDKHCKNHDHKQNNDIDKLINEAKSLLSQNKFMDPLLIQKDELINDMRIFSRRQDKLIRCQDKVLRSQNKVIKLHEQLHEILRDQLNKLNYNNDF
jgi:hypothetical protein